MRKSLVNRLTRLGVALVFLPALTLLLALHTPLQPTPAQAASLSSGWEVVPAPSLATMYALDMINASNGWAGGMDGFVFHYNGTTWLGVETHFRKAIRAISMLGPAAGWGVTATGEVVYYNGSTWEVHSKPAEALSDIQMVGLTDGWAVGAAEILRYHAPSNTWVEVVASDRWLKGIDMVNANDGWIVGIHATFLHWNGGSWTGSSQAIGVLLTDVDMVSSTNGWAVGGDGVIYHYVGGSWTQVASPTTKDLHRVHMLSKDEGWAVGEDGTILHYEGGTWQLVGSPTSLNLHDVDMLSANDGWAVGDFGTILHYTGAPPDLSVSTKTVDPTHALPGETLTYAIHLENTGANPAPAVVVTDAIPSGTTYVAGSASTTKGTFTGPDPLVVTVGDVLAGEKVTVSFQVTVDDLGLGCWFIPNEAVIDMEGEQWTRRVTTAVGDCQQIFLPLIAR